MEYIINPDKDQPIPIDLTAENIGIYSELRVLQVLSELNHPYLKSYRAATDAEDCEGVDIVVYTDRGFVYLQVKTARCKGYLRQKYERSNIQIIIVGDCSFRTLTDKTLSAILMARAKLY